jgi:hypothetical protein
MPRLIFSTITQQHSKLPAALTHTNYSESFSLDYTNLHIVIGQKAPLLLISHILLQLWKKSLQNTMSSSLELVLDPLSRSI